MRIFKTKAFIRFANKESIADKTLEQTITELETGQFDADLGGGVYKQRIARQGEGKSSGYRVLISFRHEDRSFFLYGFPKSSKANISISEKNNLKKLAKYFFSLSDNDIQRLLLSGSLKEISGE